MSTKTKGTRAERELFHLFFKNGWQPCRVAGSGSTSLPSCDLLIGGQGRILAIECKTLKKGKKYLEESRIQELRNFANNFGAEPWIAMKFDYQGWYFIHLDDLKKGNGKNYVLSLEEVKKTSLKFEDLIK